MRNPLLHRSKSQNENGCSRFHNRAEPDPDKPFSLPFPAGKEKFSILFQIFPIMEPSQLASRRKQKKRLPDGFVAADCSAFWT